MLGAGEASRGTAASQDEELGGIKHVPEHLQRLWPTTEYVLLAGTITEIESILSHRIYLRTLRGGSYAGLLLV